MNRLGSRIEMQPFANVEETFTITGWGDVLLCLIPSVEFKLKVGHALELRRAGVIYFGSTVDGVDVPRKIGLTMLGIVVKDLDHNLVRRQDEIWLESAAFESIKVT